MVLYFSGTGNSRYAARLIASVLGDDLVSINEYLKNKKDGDFHSSRPYVIVCPTYAWRIPRVVEEFLKGARLQGNKQAYFILTCGGEPGNAAPYAERLCRSKGFDFMGLAGVVMPENYIALFEVPDKEEADAVIQKALPRLQALAELIKSGRPLPPEKMTLNDKLKSGVINDVFYPLYVKAKGFYATDACIGCGKCEKLCPLNNVTLKDGRPQWGKNCTHCMACISCCPVLAIEYKNNSKGKPRYFNAAEPPV